jgi:hypothetical protein
MASGSRRATFFEDQHSLRSTRAGPPPATGYNVERRMIVRFDQSDRLKIRSPLHADQLLNTAFITTGCRRRSHGR